MINVDILVDVWFLWMRWMFCGGVVLPIHLLISAF